MAQHNVGLISVYDTTQGFSGETSLEADLRIAMTRQVDVVHVESAIGESG